MARMVLTLLTGVATDRGPVRDLNEDAYHAGPRLLVVADGIGGLPAGEVASAVAVRALAPLESARRPGAGDLRKAVDAASKSIREAVDADRSLAGMGTTLTAVLFTGSGGEAVLAHIGDSRAYLLRDRHLTRVTRDDTYVQLLIDEGVITEDEARRHAQRSLVTRALHGKPERPTITKLPVRQGDRFLLCSDGLSDVVDDDAIGQALREHADPRHCAEQLVKLALKAGGPDNVTAVIGDVVAA